MQNDMFVIVNEMYQIRIRRECDMTRRDDSEFDWYAWA